VYVKPKLVELLLAAERHEASGCLNSYQRFLVVQVNIICTYD
jgi:hypothetical protein